MPEPDTKTISPDSSSPQGIRDRFKKTWEKFRRPSTPEFKIKLPSAIEQALEKTKGTVIFGKPLHEFALGLLAGSVVKGVLKKETAKQLISLGLLQGTMGSAVVVGAVAGGGYGFGREYFKQVRQNWAETEKLKKSQAKALLSASAAFLSPEDQAKLDPEKVRLQLKERLQGLKPNDAKKLAIATGRGAILGAVGGAIGFGVAGLVGEYISGISLTSALEHAKETASSVTSHLPSAEPHLPDLSKVSETVSSLNPLHHEVPHGPSVDQATSHFPPGWSAEQPSVSTPKPYEDSGITEGSGMQYKPLTEHGGISGDVTVSHMEPVVSHPDAGGVAHPGENVSHPSTSDHNGINQSMPKENIENTQAAGLMNPQLQEAVHNLPAEVKLPEGGSVWQVTHDSLKQALGQEPTDAQILAVAKVVARENGIAVKEWGIGGTIDSRNLEVGRSIIVNDNVKNAIVNMLSKK